MKHSLRDTLIELAKVETLFAMLERFQLIEQLSAAQLAWVISTPTIRVLEAENQYRRARLYQPAIIDGDLYILEDSFSCPIQDGEVVHPAVRRESYLIHGTVVHYYPRDHEEVSLMRISSDGTVGKTAPIRTSTRPAKPWCVPALAPSSAREYLDDYPGCEFAAAG